jgi:ribosome-binding factor A
VGALLQATLSELLLRDIKDPRVGMATVTGVDLSPDLKHARVFMSVLGDAAAQQRMLAGLASARPFLQSQAGKRLKLRFTPELHFEIDPAIAAGDRIDRLLRGLTPPPDAPATAAGGEPDDAAERSPSDHADGDDDDDA